MVNIPRVLNLNLPANQSAFLWGPRKTGKSTFLKTQFPESITIDFLKTDLFLEYSKQPSLLRERLLAMEKDLLRAPVILDEVQKVPHILDEVHWLIENTDLQFILCGSSARKLKRGQANLLGGRAWRYEMFPFVYPEHNGRDILKILNQGLIPDHYLRKGYKKSLQSYVQDYLKEEVFSEGLIRNIPAFSRFFEAMGYSHGELTNYSNIARDCGVDSKTVKGYYQILQDTLLGTMVSPFKKRQNRQVISKASKFYLFDVGVAGSLCRRNLTEAKGREFGKAFEHFIFMELNAYASYSDRNYEINFWRTKTGLEVDCVLGNGRIAIEVKGTARVDNCDLKPLSAFAKEYSPEKCIVVCNEREKRVHKNITLIPYLMFLEELWAGEIIS